MHDYSQFLSHILPLILCFAAVRNLKIGYFSQHHVDQLDLNISAVELLAKRFPGNVYLQVTLFVHLLLIIIFRMKAGPVKFLTPILSGLWAERMRSVSYSLQPTTFCLFAWIPIIGASRVYLCIHWKPMALYVSTATR